MKLYLKTKDFSVSGESFNLLWDEKVDMLVTEPQPENLDPYYDSEDYISHTDAKTSLTDKLYQAVKRKNLKNKIQLLDNQEHKISSVLDIGAGTGDFLVSAKLAGFKVFGVEPNEKARQLATKKGIALSRELESFKGKSFDVITLWHVLEHLPNLEEQIKTIVSLLEPNGTLIIAVPNFKSFDAKHYGSFWAGYDVPRHLWHFSRSSISKIFANHGMELVKERPMLFDAFYVSMLSEKYRGSKLFLVKAFAVGLWSNLKAKFNGEHSSLIYILRRTE